MLQKIIKVGNSAAVTIPKSFLKQASFKVGDEVLVETDFQSETLMVRPKAAQEVTPVSKEFISWTKKFIKKYRPMLQELAKK